MVNQWYFSHVEKIQMKRNSTNIFGLLRLTITTVTLTMGLRLGSRDTFMQTKRWEPFLNNQLPKLAPATWKLNQVGNIPVGDDFFTRIKKIPETTRYAAITKHDQRRDGKVYSKRRD